MRLWHLYKQKWVYDFTLTSNDLVYLNEWKHNTLLNPIPIEKAGVVPCRKTPLVSDKGEPIYEGDYIHIRYHHLSLDFQRFDGFVTYTPLGFYLTSVEGLVLPLTEVIAMSLEGTVHIDLLGNMLESHSEEYKALREVEYVISVSGFELGIPLGSRYYYAGFKDSDEELNLLEDETHPAVCRYDSYYKAVHRLLYLRSKLPDVRWTFKIEVVGTKKDARWGWFYA
jgi:hypothetical protein